MDKFETSFILSWGVGFMTDKWYLGSIGEVLQRLGTDPKGGLSQRTAAERLATEGPNRLRQLRKKSVLGLFLAQFQDFMVMVLLFATLISVLLDELTDAVAILAIIFLNGLLGFLQEYRAERSLEALRRLTAPQARVIRDGILQQIPAEQLVPGDIVQLASGDRVPADCRLLESFSLYADESALTGESLPIAKDHRWTPTGETPLGDRKNCLYMGTVITAGRGLAVVTETGMSSEVGRIAAMLQDTGRLSTPLEARLEQLGRWLVAACVVLVVGVFATGVWRGVPVLEMFMIAVSLAVAAIPEGLPAVVTIALALGVQRMSRRAAIIRRLPAVETLGCTDIICSDKTGTLTENKMKVQRVWLAGRVYQGEALERLSPPQEGTALFWALKVCGLCNSVNLQGGMGSGFPGLQGDPTEIALVQFAHRVQRDLEKKRLETRLVGELPFTSERKRMTVLYDLGEARVGLTKGAWEVILARSQFLHGENERVLLTASQRKQIAEAAEDMAQDALRVMALAYKRSDTLIGVEEGLTFVALVGLYDPPRREVKQALRKASQAGIRTIMVTGDHKTTARAIGLELGLLEAPGEVLTGHDLDTLSDRELALHLRRVNVFSRVSPEHKLRIVRCLKSMGHVVAMTGDGVNDAPAVAEADVGVAMGQTGTDVTKEASAMVLSDDNYATIIHAIEEGRGVYENIRKFVRYLLTCNVGEVLTMFLATLLSLPLPLVAVQILWMNLVTDGLPAVALGMDPPDKDIMKRRPRKLNEHILSGGMVRKILGRGMLLAFSTLGIFALGLWLYPGDVARARSLAFSTIVLAQLFHAFECSTYGAGPRGIVANPLLVLAVGASILMQGAVIYVPWLQGLFSTVRLALGDWVLILVFAGWPLAINWTVRLVRRLVMPRVSWLRT